jgi:hypothetical protein
MVARQGQADSTLSEDGGRASKRRQGCPGPASSPFPGCTLPLIVLAAWMRSMSHKPIRQPNGMGRDEFSGIGELKANRSFLLFR